MDIQNHFYGHSAVLAAYCGLSAPKHIAGLVQHGWTPVSPIATHFADLADSAPAGNLFTWSHSSRGWTEEESQRTTGFASSPIGSPFLYLLDMVSSTKALPPKTIDTVVFPFHGTRLVSVEGNQQAYAQQVREEEGIATVCLHVDDLERPEVVKAWTSAGHQITTAGQRRDPYFLARILWLVSSARKVVSNRLATALIYAAAAGTEVSIYGPHFHIAGISETSSEDYLRRLWPEFYSTAGEDVARQKQVAEQELGRLHMRTPEELRRMLAWEGTSIRPFLDYWLAAPVQKAQNILGLKQRQVGTIINEVKLSPFDFLRHPLEHLPGRLPRHSSAEALMPELRVGR